MAYDRSVQTDQQWSDKTRADVTSWINENGQELAELHGAAAVALENLGRFLQRTKGAERADFEVRLMVDQGMDRVEAFFPGELKMWLDV